jgi:uncharacterized protein DUF4154
MSGLGARGARRWLMAAAMALAAATISVRAQGVSESELKAALLYNFARFVEWPEDVVTSSTALELCVMNDDAVAGALEGIARGRTIEGHALAIVRVKSDVVPPCHLLYLGSINAKRAAQIRESVKGLAMLTVANTPRFAETGGVAHFVTDHGKMRFAINAHAAERAGLHLSAKLLSLAILVKDDADVVPR